MMPMWQKVGMEKRQARRSAPTCLQKHFGVKCGLPHYSRRPHLPVTICVRDFQKFLYAKVTLSVWYIARSFCVGNATVKRFSTWTHKLLYNGTPDKKQILPGQSKHLRLPHDSSKQKNLRTSLSKHIQRV